MGTVVKSFTNWICSGTKTGVCCGLCSERGDGPTTRQGRKVWSWRADEEPAPPGSTSHLHCRVLARVSPGICWKSININIIYLYSIPMNIILCFTVVVSKLWFLLLKCRCTNYNSCFFNTFSILLQNNKV